jgi:SSS family solute:Na+ symporter
MGVEFWGLVFGLAFVLSFGYWCTDFLVVQRAMIARNQKDASRTPIIAAIPKLFLPLIVIIPGLIAVALENAGSGFALPLKPDGRTDFDMTLPSLLLYYYPSGLLGVGITALMASFMSGMAGNVTAFNTVFTFDLYQAYIKKNGDDKHYLRVGKMTTLVGVLLSILTAYVARSFNNIMDLLQLIFVFVNAPLFATFLLGMFWKRATGHGAFLGLVSGTAAASLTHGLTVAEGKGGWLGHVLHVFPSSMGQAFWIAIIAWSSCFSITILVSLMTKPKPGSALIGLVYAMTPKVKDSKSKGPVWLEPKWLAVVVVVLAAGMNWFFR